MIQQLVDEKLLNENLSAEDLDMVVDKLVDVVKISVVKPPVGENIVTIVSKILLSSADVNTVASTWVDGKPHPWLWTWIFINECQNVFVFSILNLTEEMGNKMNFEEESVGITVPLLAMSMVNTDVDKFSGLTFGVSIITADLAPQVRPLPQTWGCKFAFIAH